MAFSFFLCGQIILSTSVTPTKTSFESGKPLKLKWKAPTPQWRYNKQGDGMCLGPAFVRKTKLKRANIDTVTWTVSE